MSLSFQSLSQHWLFIDTATNQVVSSGGLKGEHTYRVVLLVKNPDPVYYDHNVNLKAWHSSFGIGLVGDSLDFVMNAPVEVLPGLNSTAPSYALIDMTFNSPPGYGHGCLYAQITVDGVPVADPGALISQNIDIRTAAVGQESNYWFTVTNANTFEEDMELTVLEMNEDRTPLGAGVATWNAKLIIPGPAGSGLPVPAVSPSPNPFVQTMHLAAKTPYLVQLLVTPAGVGIKRLFRISGKVGGVDQGMVEIIIKSMATVSTAKCYPWIAGGYNSPAIDLFGPDAAHPGQNIHIPHDGTKLKPSSNYTFTATVGNDGEAAATGTMVQFWWVDGGVGWNLQSLGIKTVDIPVGSTIPVTSPIPFPSAPSGEHRCAVVTLFNPNSTNCNGSDPTGEKDPLSDHNSAAWRNTDSQVVLVGGHFKLPLLVNFPIHPKDPVTKLVPVAVVVTAKHVPKGWDKQPAVRKQIDAFHAAGGRRNYPLYAVEGFDDGLLAAEMGIKVVLAGGADKKVKAELVKQGKKKPAGGTIMVPARLGNAPIEVTGTIPEDAKVGDTYLVEVAVTYPEMGGNKPITIKHLEFLRVGRKHK